MPPPSAPQWDGQRIRDYLLALANRIDQALAEDAVALARHLTERDRRIAEKPLALWGWSLDLELANTLEDCANAWPESHLGNVDAVVASMPASCLPILFPLLVTELQGVWGEAHNLSHADSDEMEFGAADVTKLPSRDEFEAKFYSLSDRVIQLNKKLREVADGIINHLAEPVPIVLHPNDVTILNALSERTVTVAQADLEARCDLSRRTISDRLVRLRELGLTWRPNGTRGGESITEAGKEALRQQKRPSH